MNTTPTQHEAEPFGYFRALPFGWEQCAETDEGAIALYEGSQVCRIPTLEAEAEALRARLSVAEELAATYAADRDILRDKVAELEAQRVALTDDQKTSLREAAQNALITLDGIASTNPRDKADFETPVEWIAWAKSRSRWAADILRGPIAQEIYAERILKKMLDDDSHGIGTKEGGK